ncbi:MAG: META domain-containing protein [Chloroflexales bacterium]|nr:META domain-containing protein [Chloroflexales bacterium]
MKRSFVGSGVLALILGVLAFVAPVHAAPAQQNDALPPEVTDIERALVSLQAPGEAAEDTTGQGLTLRFGPENAANGSGGCNTFSTTYSVGDAQSLSFTPIASTRRSCGEAADMLERRYLQTLQAVTAYSLADGRLTLTTEDGGELVYASQATTQPIQLPTTGNNEYGPLWMILVAALSAAAGLGLRRCTRRR